jgi:hypothetical protein
MVVEQELSNIIKAEDIRMDFVFISVEFGSTEKDTSSCHYLVITNLYESENLKEVRLSLLKHQAGLRTYFDMLSMTTH